MSDSRPLENNQIQQYSNFLALPNVLSNYIMGYLPAPCLQHVRSTRRHTLLCIKLEEELKLVSQFMSLISKLENIIDCYADIRTLVWMESLRPEQPPSKKIKLIPNETSISYATESPPIFTKMLEFISLNKHIGRFSEFIFSKLVSTICSRVVIREDDNFCDSNIHNVSKREVRDIKRDTYIKYTSRYLLLFIQAIPRWKLKSGDKFSLLFSDFYLDPLWEADFINRDDFFNYLPHLTNFQLANHHRIITGRIGNLFQGTNTIIKFVPSKFEQDQINKFYHNLLQEIYINITRFSKQDLVQMGFARRNLNWLKDHHFSFTGSLNSLLIAFKKIAKEVGREPISLEPATFKTLRTVDKEFVEILLDCINIITPS